MKGRKPKPTGLKLLHGSRKDRINPNEPKPEPGIPDPPDWFTPEQLAEWNDLVECMASIRILTPNERGTLIRLACARAAYAEAQQALDDEGFVITGTNAKGFTCKMVNPWTRIRRDLSAECTKLENELGGFSPTARTRVNTSPRPDPDPKAVKARRMFGK